MYCDTTLHSRKSFNIVGKYSTKIASKHHHFTKTLTRDTPSLRPLPCTTQHLSPIPHPPPQHGGCASESSNSSFCFNVLLKSPFNYFKLHAMKYACIALCRTAVYVLDYITLI